MSDLIRKAMSNNQLYLRARAFIYDNPPNASYGKDEALADIEELRRRNPDAYRIIEVCDLMENIIWEA